MNITIRTKTAADLEAISADLEGRLEVVIDDAGEDCSVADDIRHVINALDQAVTAQGEIGDITLELSHAQVEELQTTFENCDTYEDFAGEIVVPTIRQVTEARWGGLDAEILDMPIDAGCAIDCMKVIRAADALLDLLQSISPFQQQAIVDAAEHQCRVYYFG
jgi:hypothetical protein